MGVFCGDGRANIGHGIGDEYYISFKDEVLVTTHVGSAKAKKDWKGMYNDNNDILKSRNEAVEFLKNQRGAEKLFLEFLEKKRGLIQILILEELMRF